MIINNIFKMLFLIVSIVLIIILYHISSKMDNGRFVPANTNSIIDTKTGNRYYWEQDEGYSLLTDKGELVKIKQLPK